MTVTYYEYEDKMMTSDIIADMLDKQIITVEDDVNFDWEKVNKNRADAKFWCDRFGEPKFVTAYSFKKMEKSPLTIKLETKLKEIEKAFTDDLGDGKYNMFAQSKRKFTVCPNCGSKISHIFMATRHQLVHKCPVCNSSLTDKMRKKGNDNFEKRMMISRKLSDSIAIDYAKSPTYWLIRVEK